METLLSQAWLRGVRLPNSAEVETYLRQHPDMAVVVEAAVAAALERVGADTALSLELYHDPEIDDDHLTLYVRQESYDESMHQTIDEIRRAIEPALRDGSVWFSVGSDFRGQS